MRSSHAYPGNPSDPIERKVIEAFLTDIWMERHIEVGTGIGDHLDFSDVKLDARRIVLLGLGSRKVIADRWSR